MSDLSDIRRAGRHQRRVRQASCAHTHVAWEEISQFLGVLAGKWVLRVLQVLQENGPLRHNQLLRKLGPDVVSARSLDATLRRMELDELVKRKVDPGSPPAVSYGLTPLARSLITQLALLGDWAAEHLPRQRRTAS